MLTDLELFVFDTLGFVVVPGVYADRAVELKAELSPHLRTDPDQANTLSCREILARSAAVRELAQDPAIVERVRCVVNQPLRLIEAYAVNRLADSNLPLHNGFAERLTGLPGAPSQNLSQMHTYHDGRLYCMFVKALVYLDDVETLEDGPFCHVQGSHKANFALLPLLRSSPEQTTADRGFPTLAVQFVKAGDLLLLNEALMHGTLAKRSARDRNFLALSYAPSFVGDWRPREDDDAIIDSAPGHYEAYEGDIWKPVAVSD